ncbi:hypothetical protein [Accumulibacter sp.]|uniref:endonuclease/exonuclease/phosphatase family protein n=1 Tax=Accumulibacter sp. TaxID=2053492 RepID=UPI0025911631|nr:hypothetical protein [Accumulibacter sp.]
MDFTNHDISDHLLEKRGLLHAHSALAVARAGTYLLICVHLGLIKRSRLRQAIFLADFVQREVPAKSPLIIAGDFNDWQQRVDGLLATGSASMKSPWPPRRRRPTAGSSTGCCRGAPSAIRGPEWRVPSRVLPVADARPRIYVRGFPGARHARVPKGLAWARCSDHAPLIAELEL